MAKETKEFNLGIHTSIKSGYQSASDGQFNLTDVLQYWIDDIGVWQEGLKDFAPTKELAQATNAEMDDINQVAADQMDTPVIPQEDAYDIKAFTGGIWSLIRFISRKSYKAGQEDTIKKLAAAGLIPDADAALAELTKIDAE